MYLKHYMQQLGYSNIPEFLIKYLETPSLLRLKKVGYFCGMDYASKSIYNFRENISRYDHSLTVSLIVYKLTQNKTATIAGLFHDVASPCFSHVIDYMNKDYEKQESTEEFTENILKNDKYLAKCLKEDNYMMQLLANITKIAIDKNYIKYDDLYSYNEEELFKIFKTRKDTELENLIFNFENVKKEDVPYIELPELKERSLNPIVEGKRVLTIL